MVPREQSLSKWFLLCVSLFVVACAADAVVLDEHPSRLLRREVVKEEVEATALIQIAEGMPMPIGLKPGWRSEGGLYKDSAYTLYDRSLCLVVGLAEEGKWTDPIAELPEDCRPTRRLMFNLNNGEQSARIDVWPDGKVQWEKGGSEKLTQVSLAGMTFGTDPRETHRLSVNQGWGRFGQDYVEPGYTVTRGLCTLEGAAVRVPGSAAGIAARATGVPGAMSKNEYECKPQTDIGKGTDPLNDQGVAVKWDDPGNFGFADVEECKLRCDNLDKCQLINFGDVDKYQKHGKRGYCIMRGGSDRNENHWDGTACIKVGPKKSSLLATIEVASSARKSTNMTA
jgi:hypothetical protein